MEKTELESRVEALLFYVGDMISKKRLSELCDTDIDTIACCIKQLQTFYKMTNSGLDIIEVDDGYQMCTATKHTELIQMYQQKPMRHTLTQALLETLAIIAYSQPITRTQIEEIRGVRCEHAITKLMEYGLIEEVGRLSVIGRPILFGTTHDFLRYFGFKSLEEMPHIKEDLLEQFKREVTEEMKYYEEDGK